jgi:site-specific DNA recombinase
VETKRCAIYVRTASEGQRDAKGLASQEQACHQYAEEHDYLVAQTFGDAGCSGLDARRPGLLALRDAVRRGDIDGVVCMDPDRLSRDSIQLAGILAEAEHAGCTVDFVSGSVPPAQW